MTLGPNASIYFDRLYLQILKDLPNFFSSLFFNITEFNSSQKYPGMNRMNVGVIYTWSLIPDKRSGIRYSRFNFTEYFENCQQRQFAFRTRSNIKTIIENR